MKTELEWELDSPEYIKWCEIINKLSEIEDDDLKTELIFSIQDLSLILENKNSKE